MCELPPGPDDGMGADGGYIPPVSPCEVPCEAIGARGARTCRESPWGLGEYPDAGPSPILFEPSQAIGADALHPATIRLPPEGRESESPGGARAEALVSNEL